MSGSITFYSWKQILIFGLVWLIRSLSVIIITYY